MNIEMIKFELSRIIIRNTKYMVISLAVYLLYRSGRFDFWYAMTAFFAVIGGESLTRHMDEPTFRVIFRMALMACTSAVFGGLVQFISHTPWHDTCLVFIVVMTVSAGFFPFFWTGSAHVLAKRNRLFKIFVYTMLTVGPHWLIAISITLIVFYLAWFFPIDPFLAIRVWPGYIFGLTITQVALSTIRTLRG